MYEDVTLKSRSFLLVKVENVHDQLESTAKSAHGTIFPIGDAKDLKGVTELTVVWGL